MYKLKVNDKYDYSINLHSEEIILNDEKATWDEVIFTSGSQHILINNKSYNISVSEINRKTKTISLLINNNSYTVTIQEPIDVLLESLGINLAATQKVEPMKAPMPGLVLKILVTPGQTVKKGEAVLILEAMKMENVFKAQHDAVVKNIATTEGKAVEKGEVLLEWE